MMMWLPTFQIELLENITKKVVSLTGRYRVPGKIFERKSNASSFCPDKIKIALDKFFFPIQKSSYLLGKGTENDFLVMEKILSVAKKSFSIDFTNKYVLF